MKICQDQRCVTSLKDSLKTGDINKKEKGGKKHEKITEDVKQYVKNTVDEYCTISLQKITNIGKGEI